MDIILGLTSRWLLFLLATFSLVSCAPPTPDLSAIKQHRLTETSIIAANLSEDGELSALVTETLLVQVWNNETGKQAAQWDANNLGIRPLFIDISTDKHQLLLASETQVVLLDITQNTEIGRWPFEGLIVGQKITVAKYFQDVEAFVVGMNDGTIILADFIAGVFKRAPIHASSVTHFSLDASQQYLISAGHDGVVNKLSREDLTVIASLTFEHRISSLEVDKKTNRLFVSDVLDGQIVFDGNTYKPIGDLHYSERWRWFRHAKFVRNGQFLITANPKTALFLWNVKTGKQLGFLDAQVHSLASQVAGLAINKDDQLVTLTNDGVVQWWQYQSLLFER